MDVKMGERRKLKEVDRVLFLDRYFCIDTEMLTETLLLQGKWIIWQLKWQDFFSGLLNY